MINIWVDAHISPSVALWLNDNYPELKAASMRSLNMLKAEDAFIFMAARKANAVLMTKDADFVALLHRHGPPPQIIWITTGNTSNENLKRILASRISWIIKLIQNSEPLIEIAE